MKFQEMYLSRRLILFFDILFTLLSIILSYLIRFDFVDFYDLFWHKEFDSVIWGVPSLILVRLMCFLIGGMHKGIIRHLSAADTKRIFIIVSL